MALTGTDSILLPSDAVLKFSHPHPLLKNDPLYVRSGANSIKWAYNLNTQVTPTYGGEVVQVLSCNVGPITIQGQTMGRRHSNAAGTRDPNYTSNDELKRIMDWFLTYMHIAGTAAHSERGILFEYPARGWSFYIQVTSLDGFKYALEQQHSAPWSITAEIISDNDVNYFTTTTMERFTDAVTSRALLARMNRFASIGFDPHSPTINPIASENAVKDLKQFHNNFQSLVAAWSTGDFAHFGFDQLADSGANFSQTSREYWTQVFGSDYINGGPTGGHGLGSPVTYSGDVNSIKRSDLIEHIASAFDNEGIPGDIGIAVAFHESGLDPDARQPNGDFAMGLFQTFPLGAGGSYHKAELTNAYQNVNEKVTKYYPVGMQIADAASWFAAKAKSFGTAITDTTDDHTKAVFAQYAQRGYAPGNPNYSAAYTADVENRLRSAQALLRKIGTSGEPNNIDKTGIIATHGSMTPVRIVLHDTEGTLDPRTLPAFFSAQGQGFGCHVSIGQDGTSVRLAADNQITWHTGGANEGSLGIEICAPSGAAAGWSSGDWLNHPRQLRAVAAWIAYWSKKYNIPLVASADHGVSTHKMQSAIHPESEGHFDPGNGFPFDYVLSLAKATF